MCEPLLNPYNYKILNIKKKDTKQNIMITKQELIEQAQRELDRSFKFLANGELSKYVKSQNNVDRLIFRIDNF